MVIKRGETESGRVGEGERGREKANYECETENRRETDEARGRMRKLQFTIYKRKKNGK
jgi:hypothetical protein